MKKTLKRKIAAGLCAYFCAGSIAIGNCASPADFKKEEYWQSTGLDIINAADVYALGYTGAGITLGIYDDYVNLAHPEFSGKQNSSLIGALPQGYDWPELFHGSHVAGIMAAAKDGMGMHGLAFNADLRSGLFVEGEANLQAAYGAFCADHRIKVINNSWGMTYYYDELSPNKQEFILLIEKDDRYNTYGLLRGSIVDYDKVIVFGAGNNGHATSMATGLLPYLYPETAGNFINVMAVDPVGYDKAAQSVVSNFPTVWSNMTKYVEENSIAAPGYGINSVSAADGGYMKISGTSMAAPYVSAAAGLVQQAFPYMNGRQITDTVLSSANASFSLPEYVLTIQGDGEEKFNLFYFGDRPNDAKIENDLRQYYRDNMSISDSIFLWYGIETEDEWVERIKDCTLLVYDNVPREMIFGQGLLDVGAAVRGPGLLNARRLDKGSYSDQYGRAQALYAIDTKGFDSVWANDIGEKRAGLLAADSAYEDLRKIYGYYLQGDHLDGSAKGQSYIDEYNAKVLANGLKDLPVGLYKQGFGTLALTGNNTYTGAVSRRVAYCKSTAASRPMPGALAKGQSPAPARLKATSSIAARCVPEAGARWAC